MAKGMAAWVNIAVPDPRPPDGPVFGRWGVRSVPWPDTAAAEGAAGTGGLGVLNTTHPATVARAQIAAQATCRVGNMF